MNKLIKDIKANNTLGMRVTLWLSKNDEIKALKPESRALLEQTLMNAEREDRSGLFHASSSGQCMRRQFLAYIGAEQEGSVDATLRAIFHDGHFRHLRWQIMLLEAGIIDVVEKRFNGMELPQNYLLTGSVDGLNTSEEWVFELKGTNPQNFSKVMRNGVMPAHLRQVHAYFLLTGYERAIIVYDNKANQTFEEFEVHRSEDVMDDVEYEFETLTKHAIEGSFPEMKHLCKTKEGDEYERCPFASVCPNAEQLYDIAK